MAVREIVTIPDEVLRRKAREVKIFDEDLLNIWFMSL